MTKLLDTAGQTDPVEVMAKAGAKLAEYLLSGYGDVQQLAYYLETTHKEAKDELEFIVKWNKQRR